MAPPAEVDLVANVRKATGTAVTVLRHMEQSLRRAGFGTGVSAYEQLAETLAGQRMWALGKGDAEIERNFAELSASAVGVRLLLAPYLRVMDRIGALGALGESSPVATVEEPPADTSRSPEQARVAQALAAASRPLTLSALRERSGLGSRELRRILDEMEQAGVVARAGPAERPRFTLATP